MRLGGEPPCREVQTLIERRLAEVDKKLADLRCVRSSLADALERCGKSKRKCAVVAELKRKNGKRRPG